MMGATLVVPSAIADSLAEAAREHNEAAGVLLAGLSVDHGGQPRVLVRELHWVPEETYVERLGDRLVVRSVGYVPTLARAEQLGAVAIWLHTHPGGDPTPSNHDALVDRQLSEPFRVRTGKDFYGSVVISPDAASGFRFTGHIWLGDQHHSATRAWVVGPRLRLISAVDASSAGRVPALFDRQVRAFGGDVQAVLSRVSMAVVGCGGTGSAVAEQLIRLGVDSLLLIDPDVIEDTNLTRVYGSTPETVGKPKAEALAQHLSTVMPGASIRSIVGPITSRSVATALSEVDLIFGCTDDNAGRIVLSRLSTYYLTPVFDCGVVIDSTDGKLRGIYGRVTILAKGYACLICRDRIDLQRAAAEQLNSEERQARQDEGYAPELGGIEPAVVPYTSLVASLATGELLERLIGYGPVPAPSELLVRAHDREISTNSRPPRHGHYCDPTVGQAGTGDCEPFMQVTWPRP